MARESGSDGFTLIEVMVSVGIVGVLALVMGVNMRDSLGEMRAKGAVRRVADLLMLARTEAIRTGDNHIVFLFRDAQDNPINVPAGGPAAAILVRDANGNGTVVRCLPEGRTLRSGHRSSGLRRRRRMRHRRHNGNHRQRGADGDAERTVQ